MVSIRGFLIVTCLLELDGLNCWAADVTQAYLASYTSEKLHNTAGMFWTALRLLLLWPGDTFDLIDIDRQAEGTRNARPATRGVARIHGKRLIL